MEREIILLDNQLCIVDYIGSDEEYGIGRAIDYIVARWNTYLQDNKGEEFDFRMLKLILETDFDCELDLGYKIIDIDKELKTHFPKVA
jgi:hypothetical protein